MAVAMMCAAECRATRRAAGSFSLRRLEGDVFVQRRERPTILSADDAGAGVHRFFGLLEGGLVGIGGRRR